jgi:hypothetical protein
MVQALGIAKALSDYPPACNFAAMNGAATHVAARQAQIDEAAREASQAIHAAYDKLDRVIADAKAITIARHAEARADLDPLLDSVLAPKVIPSETRVSSDLDAGHKCPQCGALTLKADGWIDSPTDWTSRVPHGQHTHVATGRSCTECEWHDVEIIDRETDEIEQAEHAREAADQLGRAHFGGGR